MTNNSSEIGTIKTTLDTKADKTALTNLSTVVNNRLTTLESDSGKCLDEEFIITPLQGASEELLDKMNEIEPDFPVTNTTTETISARNAITAAYQNAGMVKYDHELLTKPKITELQTQVSTHSETLTTLRTDVDSKAAQSTVDELTTTVNNKANKSEVLELPDDLVVTEQKNRMLQIFPTPKEECYGYYDADNNDFVYGTVADTTNLKNAEIICITSVKNSNGLWKKYCDALDTLTDEETPELKKIVFAGDDFVMNDIIYYSVAGISKYLANLTEIHVNIRFGKTGVMSTDIGGFYDMLNLRTAMEAQTLGYQKIKVFIHKYAGALNMSVQDMYFSNLTDLFYLQGVLSSSGMSSSSENLPTS